MTLRVYDPDQVFISIAGIPVSGFADGEFLRVEPENNAFDDVVGTDGEVSRSKTNDHRATITLRLMQTSPSNTLLSALYTSDVNTPGGVGVGPFLVNDKSGTSIGVAEKCWIAKAPNMNFDRTAVEREWMIRCDKWIPVHGSN